MNRLLAASWTLIFILATSSLQADWPSFLHGNARTGATTDSLPVELAPAWVYNAPAAPQRAFAGPRLAPIEGREMRHRIDFDGALQPVMVVVRLGLGLELFRHPQPG